MTAGCMYQTRAEIVIREYIYPVGLHFVYYYIIQPVCMYIYIYYASYNHTCGTESSHVFK